MSVKTFRFDWTDADDETEYRLLEDPDGVSGYTQIATLPADSTGHDLVVFLPERVNARYILQACDDAGCTDSAPVAVSGSLAEAVGYVKASNTDRFDRFGASVALSADGTTLAVGAATEYGGATGVNGDETDNSAVASGAVYVYVRTGTTWSRQAYVKASNTGARDRFGETVALSGDGNILAVGAPDEDGSATGIYHVLPHGAEDNDAAPDSGAVYVFTRSGMDWSQHAYVKAGNTGTEDRFGAALALSGDGDTLAVGAPAEDNRSGAVYVFTRAGPLWSQQVYAKAPNSGIDDRFGAAVALSEDGNTLAVGAYWEDSWATGINGDQFDDSITDSGAAYVFVRNGTAWSHQAYVKASNTGIADRFGEAVALSGDGNTLAVGAKRENSGATGVGGDELDDSVDSSGAVYVYTRSGTDWSQQAYLKASNTAIDLEFGAALSLSADGNRLVVGAAGDDSGATGIDGNDFDTTQAESGAAWLFTRDGTTWRQAAYLKAANTETEDAFGASVALSADGQTLAVGAPGEDGGASGLDGDQGDGSAADAGAVYLY